MLHLLLALVPLWFAEDKPPAWSDTAELSYVLTSGNTNTNTLGFKNTLKHEWDKSTFTLNAGGVRTQNEKVTRYAVGTTGSFNITENKETTTSAELYYLNGGYGRKITDRFF